MAAKDFKRKLTAILSADVVGYSRLIGEDELSNVRTLETYREMLAEVISNYSGRAVRNIKGSGSIWPGFQAMKANVSVIRRVTCKE